MRSTQVRVLAVIFAALTVFGSAAQADVWRNVALGMNLLDYNFDAQRNYLGNGWDVTATAVYSGQEYDFGFAELVLGSSASPTASNFTFGYTTRGLPKAEFSWNTGGKALPYTLEFNNGFQDFTTLNGSILVDVSTDVNILGFYDTRVQISNRAQGSTDGFLGNEDGDLSFDVGPIDLSGNIYVDALAAITQPLWSATNMENPFVKISQAATKTAAANATIDELRARIEAGEILSEEEMTTLVNSTLLSALLSGDASQGNLFQDLLTTMETKETTVSTRAVMGVPEPATALILLGAGGLLIVRRSRR